MNKYQIHISVNIHCIYTDKFQNEYIQFKRPFKIFKDMGMSNTRVHQIIKRASNK